MDTRTCFCDGRLHIQCCSGGRNPGIFHKRCCGDDEAIVAPPFAPAWRRWTLENQSAKEIGSSPAL